VNSTITPEQFEVLLPLACEWAAAQEQRILATGEALSDAMLGDARLVGVAIPERVRLLYVPEIPIPDNPALCAAVEETQFLSPAHPRSDPALWHLYPCRLQIRPNDGYPRTRAHGAV